MKNYAWRSTTIPKVVRNETMRLNKDDRLAIEHGGQFAGLMPRVSNAGRKVNINSAMEHSVVWACLKQSAQTIASLPLGVFEKTGDGDREQIDDRLSELLTVSPNSHQTALEHWEGQLAWMMANGNCYSERSYTGKRLTALEPLAASDCEPVRGENGQIEFVVRDRGKKEVLPASKVFHVKGFGFGGLKGMSAIRYGVQSLGAGLAADQAAAKHFGQGMMPSGVFRYENTLSEEQRERMTEILEDYSSSENAAKVMVLEGGLDYKPVSLNPEDAQLLDTRRFSVEDICRWFGVPPIVVGHSVQGQTMFGSGVEQILISWLSQGLNPLMRRVEARMLRDLVRSERPKAYAEWNREGMLQMESKAKAEFLKTLVNSGLMTPNEARAKLNLPKMPGGNVLLVQGAMITLEELLSRKEVQP